MAHLQRLCGCESDICNVVRMYDYVMSLSVRGQGGADKEIMRIITAYR
jgi:hypothetical protein